MAIGKVEVWQMTEEERLAYIEKHPVKPVQKGKKRSGIDYKWRGKKAAESHWGHKQSEEEII